MQQVTAKNVEAAVFSAIDRLQEVLPTDCQLARNREALLLAEGTALDSMAVVNLLVFIEEEMLNSLGVEIILAGAEEGAIDPEALGTVGMLIDAISTRVT